MKKLLLALLLIGLPQVAMARVYMCTDHATGKTVFTDKACTTDQRREEVRLDATNLDSGKRSRKAGKRKTWNSQREDRLSGMEYNDRRREIYQAGTAKID